MSDMVYLCIVDDSNVSYLDFSAYMSTVSYKIEYFNDKTNMLCAVQEMVRFNDAFEIKQPILMAGVAKFDKSGRIYPGCVDRVMNCPPLSRNNDWTIISDYTKEIADILEKMYVYKRKQNGKENN